MTKDFAKQILLNSPDRAKIINKEFEYKNQYVIARSEFNMLRFYLKNITDDSFEEPFDFDKYPDDGWNFFYHED